jgi:hypothetical protein
MEIKLEMQKTKGEGVRPAIIEIPRYAVPRRRALIRADSSATIVDDR